MLGGNESMILEDFDAAPASIASCEICGSTQFVLEAGFYYCSICSTQSQHTREYIEEDNALGRFNAARGAVLRDPATAAKKRKAIEKDSKEIITSYELHNRLLKAMTEKLIELGFPSLLMTKVFQIWTTYLKRREAIFVSKVDPSKRSKVTIGDSILNTYALYDIPTSRLYEHAKYRRNNQEFRHFAKSNPQIDGNKGGDKLVSLSQQRRKKTMTTRKALETDYTQSQAVQSQTDKNELTIIPDEILPPSTTTTESQNVTVSKKLETEARLAAKWAVSLKGASQFHPKERDLVLTAAAKKLKNALKKTCPPIKVLQSRTTYGRIGTSMSLDLLRVERFTLKFVLILIFVAIRQIGCNVCFSDLARLFKNGTLYVRYIQNLLEEEEMLNTSGRSNSFLLSGRFIGRYSFEDGPIIDEFIKYVGLERKFRVPRLEDVLPKIIEDLCLPREFEVLCLEMNKLIPLFEELLPDISRGVRKWRSVGEIYVQCYMLIALKMLFGLDDVTEKFQSRFARTLNYVIFKADRVAARKNKENRFKSWKSRRGRPEDSYFKKDRSWLKAFVFEDWISNLRYRTEMGKCELLSMNYYDSTVPINLIKLNDLSYQFASSNINVDPRAKTRLEACERGKTFFADIVQKHIPDNTIPLVESYHTLKGNIASVSGQYTQKVTSNTPVFYPTFKINKLMEDFTNHRIDFVTKPEKYKQLLKSAGYKVYVVRGSAASYDPQRLQKWWNKKNSLILFQPFKAFDEILPHTSTASDTVSFLADLLNRSISSADLYGHIARPVLHSLFYYMARIIVLRCRSGCVGLPLLTDSEVEDDLMDKYKMQFDDSD